MTLDFPTPPLPDATKITFVRASAVNGDGRPSTPVIPARSSRRSSSVIVSSVTCTPSTPARPATASLTRRWISALSGHPATVSLTLTATRPPSTLTSPTMPRSTMLR